MRATWLMASPQPSPGMTLERRYFIDDDIFAAETENIFHHRWLHLVRESALENSGDFFTVNLAGEDLLVVRDGETVRVHHNHCRHRGTQLCSEISGQSARVFTCPYHAWSYGLDGRLIGAPHMEETSGFDKTNYPLHAPAQVVWEGNVFVNFAESPEPFEQAYAPILTKFAAWHWGELQIAHTEVYEVAANWKLIVQNYSECYHCPIIHPELEKLSHYRATENDLTEGPFLGGPMQIAREGGGLSTGGERTAPPLPGVTGADLQNAYYYHLFPSLLVSFQPEFVLMHHLERVAVNHTRITCHWLYHPEAIATDGFNAQPAVELWDKINRQDWNVSELTQLGLASRAHTPGPYSALESMPAAFDREYLRAME